MFSWLMYTHHCCETKPQHWVLLFNAFTKRHKCYYITDLILKDYLGTTFQYICFPLQFHVFYCTHNIYFRCLEDFSFFLLEVIVGCYGLNRIPLKRNVGVLNPSALDCALVWK